MIEKLLAKAPKGNRIEFGVFRGVTLEKIVDHPGVTVGVDTFAGMPEPGEHDLIDGYSPYPKGRLRATYDSARLRVPGAQLVQGTVPTVLSKIDLAQFGFAHVDLDHYASTLAALKWSWARMVRGGILCAHDWIPQRNCLASKAIKEFTTGHVYAKLNTLGQWAWWKRA